MNANETRTTVHRVRVLFGFPVTLCPDISRGASTRQAPQYRSSRTAVMLDSVRCLMSAVMSADRSSGGAREQSSKVRVHRISSRYPAVEVRTRMDSYGAPAAVTMPRSTPSRARAPVLEDDVAPDDRSDDDDDDDGDDDQKTDTAAGCSSASDTDFYYEDRTERTRVHTTVVELRSDYEAGRTETVQEEFHDSLMLVGDNRGLPYNVQTKHRHVLSESCRVKVQNLRYASTKL